VVLASSHAVTRQPSALLVDGRSASALQIPRNQISPKYYANIMHMMEVVLASSCAVTKQPLALLVDGQSASASEIP